jgi:hypothetical protein
MSTLISADVLRWLLCPAADAHASWLPASAAARVGRSRQALYRASRQLLRAAPRLLPQPPLSLAWCQWLMQPEPVLRGRLNVLTAILLQPTIRRHVHGPRRRQLLDALGAADFRAALDYPLETEQEQEIESLSDMEPEWTNADACCALGLGLSCSLLDAEDVYMGFRLRLKFHKALAPAADRPQPPALGAPSLHALARSFLLEATGDEHR